MLQSGRRFQPKGDQHLLQYLRGALPVQILALRLGPPRELALHVRSGRQGRLCCLKAGERTLNTLTGSMGGISSA